VHKQVAFRLLLTSSAIADEAAIRQLLAYASQAIATDLAVLLQQLLEVVSSP
jgi:hypothetical protein